VYWLNVLVIAPIWGMLSVQLFLQGLIGLLNFPVAVVAVVRKTLPPEMSIAAASGSVGMAVIYFGLLSLGIYVMNTKTSFGATISETIVFWVFAIFALWFMAGQVIGKIMTNWRHCTIPGAWLKDHNAQEDERYEKIFQRIKSQLFNNK